VQGGAVESQPLTRGLCNTVQAAVELDLKKKFQIRLKSNGSNGFKFPSNFDYFKQDLPTLQKFKTKYCFEYIGEMNNFLHRNFSRFKMVWELKFREAYMS
jgi:hypothetical protein